MSRQPNSSLKVLIVDDDPDQLSLRALLLGQAGFEAVEAHSALEALQAMAARRPDCAVVDLCLPTEAAGLQLIADLKQRCPDLRVFVLTGKISKTLDSELQRPLVEEVLVKGNSTRELLDRLRRLQRKLSVAV